MKSERQIEIESMCGWVRRQSRRLEEEEKQQSNPLADYIFSSEMADVSIFKDSIGAATESPQALQEFISFEGMNDDLYLPLSHLFLQLIDREDISQLDYVVDRIVDFVQICRAFHHLRFAKQIKRNHGEPFSDAGKRRLSPFHEDDDDFDECESERIGPTVH